MIKRTPHHLAAHFWLWSGIDASGQPLTLSELLSKLKVDLGPVTFHRVTLNTALFLLVGHLFTRYVVHQKRWEEQAWRWIMFMDQSLEFDALEKICLYISLAI